MKSGVAMMLAAFQRAAEGDTPPPGDVVLCLLSDEEAGGDHDARYVIAFRSMRSSTGPAQRLLERMNKAPQ